MHIPRPGKYVIHDEDEEKRFDFSKYLRRRKPSRSFRGTLIMLIIVVVVYFFLQSLLK
ncbi:MAG: hypothetical protein J7K63_06025 [Candidatus Marinimicrobia bacterium]|nr:hypothetical protein [Candidatus Neomarinimicrobiota bacterium]